ncbi:hypothetical protein [Empedobacter sp. ULE_I140]
MKYDIGRLRMTSIKLFLNKKPNRQADLISASYYRQSEWAFAKRCIEDLEDK